MFFFVDFKYFTNLEGKRSFKSQRDLVMQKIKNDGIGSVL